MAQIVYQGPDGIVEEEVDVGRISESGKVRGVRIKRDGEYLHVPDARIYRIRMSEEEGQVDYSSS